MKFKLWYNQTFTHRRECHEYLDNDDVDDAFCSCSHRPYKFTSSQWSLSKAIKYTFGQYLYNHMYGINKCLAITKLALVIGEKWSRQQIEDYISEQISHRTK